MSVAITTGLRGATRACRVMEEAWRRAAQQNGHCRWGVRKEDSAYKKILSERWWWGQG